MQWFFSSRHMGSWVLCVMAWGAQAQSITLPTASGHGVAMPGGYASPLANYRPYVETPIQDWNRANQTVQGIGGWRAYAQEAQPGASAHRQEAVPGTTASDPSKPHQGH